MALGLRGANDRSMAIQVIAAARVFVCDNMCFSGSDGSVVLRKKHTSRLDLAAVVPPAIDQFIERAGAYGFVMASNYNSKPLAAEVLVQNGQASLIRARQTLDDLIRGERIP